MRVLTVATRPSSEQSHGPEPAGKNPSLLPVGPATTLTKNVLAYPAQVTEQFNDPRAQPIVHIPLPGWVWNLERRHQWRSALESWQHLENLVLLIELPPASQPESILLAEHLPQVIWLAASGQADLEKTRTQLETLRHARCNLVGAVLNREASSFVRRYLGPWIRRFSLLLATTLLVGPRAAVPEAGPNAPQAAGAAARTLVSSPAYPRARWLERLTLGPGDSFDLSVFGHPDLTRTNLVVGPDGQARVNLAQVEEIPVAGLTIDELRARLDQELAPFFTGGVRTIIIPNAFVSKKYYVLGKVTVEGVYILDRPITIVEAVARAHGLQSGAFDRNTLEATDMSRSFLARAGKRVPLDFAKLFYQGDLSQNVALEPNDYLYFAPAALQEVYVLGEILAPGRVVATSDATLLRAITARGGFTEQAYRRRVLVIRGSLQQPEAFAVDAPAILAGRIPDFKLEAKDIIYVNHRPWVKVEELLDVAAQAFIDSAVTVWVGGNVPAVFVSPVLPKL
jgi:protein involved in polysaccharide export with SLBB domain